MAGSIGSLEGFSPSSHGGETIYYGAAGRGAGGWLGRREACYEDKEEEWQIPWVLIPITGPWVCLSVCAAGGYFTETLFHAWLLVKTVL